jgi:hypothetical protein
MLNLPLLVRLSLPVAPVAQTARVPLVPEGQAPPLVLLGSMNSSK